MDEIRNMTPAGQLQDRRPTTGTEYLPIVIEIIRFGDEDVITTSNNSGEWDTEGRRER